MREEYKYKVISKIEHKKIHPKLRDVLSKINVGETISVNTLFNKYISVLGFNSKVTAKNYISEAIKTAYKLEAIARIDNISVSAWFMGLETISFWQSQLRGNKLKNIKSTNISTTKSQYLLQLWHFNKWLLGRQFTINSFESNNNKFILKTYKKEFVNVEELLRFSEQPFIDHKNITRIIKQYLMDESNARKKATSMTVIKSAIISYFEKNDCDIHVKYNPKSTHDTETEDQSMSISELIEFLTTGKPSIVEKTLFLCKFHRGLDVSTLVDRFNYEAWEQITKWFRSENHNSWDLEKCPVPIVLTRIKTDYKHTGFLDRDAIDMICKYLDHRKKKTGSDMSNGDALFLNKMNKPVSRSWVFCKFRNMAERAGIQKVIGQNIRKQYKMDSHELRDLLKSTLIDSGCRIDVADHVIGHKPKDSYEKQAKLYPETLRKEYAKASKRLNIFTKFTSVVNGTDDADELRISLKDKLDELEKIKQRSLDDEAEKIRNDKMAEQNARQMSQMMDMINELKTQINSTKNNKSDELEFCCIKCSTIHKNQKCPVCDSKLKRIYE